MQKLVDLYLMLRIELGLILKLQTTECMHSLIPNLRIIIEQVGQHGLAHE